MIKKASLLLLAAAFLFSLQAAAMEEASAGAAEAAEAAVAETTAGEDSDSRSDGNLYRMGRGITNVATCWLEIPRCMLYDNSVVPFWGLIVGTVEGAGCTTMRAFSGVIDVISLGFDAGRMYDEDFRDFVWNSAWLPATE